MPKTPVAEVFLDVDPQRKTVGKPEPDSPFHILILGDFSGRTSRGVVEPLAGRRPVFVDRDEIDSVMRSLGIQLRLPLGAEGATADIAIQELDDFHPDRVLESQPLFHALKQMRKRLENPATFRATTDEILGGLARAPEPAPAQASSSIVTGSLLDAIVEGDSEPAGPSAPKRKPADALLAYVHDLVAPHLEKNSDPQQKQLLAELDLTIAGQMRALLHQPLFQGLESSWRALDWLVRNTETDRDLKIYLFDVSKAELFADLATASDLRKTGLFRLLVTQPVQGEPWSLLGADLYFRPWIEEIELLARLAMIADQAGAPLLSAADPSVLGVKNPEDLRHMEDWDDDNALWAEIRRLPEARRLGMALPRFLLRLPYGKLSNPTERFVFEEMPNRTSVHAGYLWGNPMYACVQLIAHSFAVSKWDMRPGQFQNIDNLPLHSFVEYGSPEVKPCAEVLLTLQAAERMIGHGLMPLLTMKGTDTVRVGMFQSIADPPSPLEGRWR
jgi:type VI secretion system protein ImpC